MYPIEFLRLETAVSTPISHNDCSYAIDDFYSFMLISHVKYAQWMQTDDGLRLGSHNFSFDISAPRIHAAAFNRISFCYTIDEAFKRQKKRMKRLRA